jgi:hypothetical protein
MLIFGADIMPKCVMAVLQSDHHTVFPVTVVSFPARCYALLPAGDEAHRPRRPNRAAVPDGREAVQGGPDLFSDRGLFISLRDSRSV